jgi:hypothetical protein
MEDEIMKQFEVGKTYKVESLGKIVKVKVTEKLKNKNFCRVEYAYPEMNCFGCTKGWQFGNTADFPNIMAIAE